MPRHRRGRPYVEPSLKVYRVVPPTKKVAECEVCDLPRHIRQDIATEFHNGMAPRTVEKWLEQEYGLKIDHIKLFLHYRNHIGEIPLTP